MPAIDNVDRIVPVVYSGMRVTPQYVDALFGLIQAAKEQKKWQGKAEPVDMEDGSVGWQVQVLYDDDRVPLMAHPGYWIFPDNELNIEVLKPHEGVARYQKNIPFEWDGTVTPPQVAKNEDGTIHVRFRQPKSINGPWTYSVTRVDAADGTTVGYTPLLDPIVEPVCDNSFRFIGADVYFDIAGALVEGREYAFKVTATASTYGTTAVTPLSDTIAG